LVRSKTGDRSEWVERGSLIVKKYTSGRYDALPAAFHYTTPGDRNERLVREKGMKVRGGYGIGPKCWVRETHSAVILGKNRKAVVARSEIRRDRIPREEEKG